jgi:hypothetical protein
MKFYEIYSVQYQTLKLLQMFISNVEDSRRRRVDSTATTIQPLVVCALAASA